MSSPETTTVLVFVCRACGHMGQPVSEWYPDRSGGAHRCARCRFICGIWLEQGTLDLGLVQPDAPAEDFQIFDGAPGA